MEPTETYNFKSILIKNTNHLYPLQYYVPNEIVTTLKDKKIKRLKVVINENEAFAGSLIPGGKKNYFLKVNNDQVTKMGLAIGKEASISISADTSEYGMPLPEEFSAIWEVDDEAHKHFHALTPGKQRNLIYIVNKVKSLEIRARKATVIMEHLVINEGKLDFKMLNEALKQR